MNVSNWNFCLLVNAFKTWILCFSSGFFGSYNVFSCYSTICERKNANRKAQKNSVCINARYFLNLHYFMLLISWKKKKKKSVWWNPPPDLCQWLELDTHCYFVSENASSTDTTRAAQHNILKSILHPILPVWLFQQNFNIRKFSRILYMVFTPILIHPGKVWYNTNNYREIIILILFLVT